MQASLMLLCLILGADAKIHAPDVATSGSLVAVSGTDAVGMLTWTVTPPTATVFTESTGREIVIRMPASGLVKIKQTAKDNAGTSSDVAIIEVGGSAPNPAPVPDATLPDGRFKIAALVRDNAPAASANRKAEAALITNRLTLLRESIEQGKIKTDDPNVVIAGIKATLRPLPAEVKSRWSEWAQVWSHAVTTACNDGKILSGADWAVLLDETCAGLKAVK